jgi:hypothetical protein
MALQHLRSSTADKRPAPASMSDGQLAINTNLASPGLFFKDSNGDLVKTGPVHVGTTAPNATPASGGTAGNSKGELWLDTTSSDYTLKTWDGSAWRGIVVTSTMIKDGTIVNADINASAAIAGTKVAPDFGSQNVLTTGTATAASLNPTGSSVPTNGVYLPATNSVAISTNGTGRLFVASDGKLLAGIADSSENYGFRLEGLGGGGFLASTGNNTATFSPAYAVGRRRGSLASVIAGDSLGKFSNLGWDGSNYIESAKIEAFVDGTPNTGVMPGRLVFSTTPSGSGTPTERMRLDSSGRLGLGTSSPDALLTVNGVGAFGAGTAALPSIARSSDLDTGAWFPAANTFAASTAGVERLRIDSTGRVGIGTTSPATTLDVNGDVTITDKIIHGGDTNTAIRFPAADTVSIETDGSERARIDSSGRLLVGTSTSRSWSGISSQFQIENTGSSSYTSQSIIANTNDTVGGLLVLGKSRGTSLGSNTAVQNNDLLGRIYFYGADGSQLVQGATIEGWVDGTPGADDMPGRLVFSTTADGSASPTERMRITNDGIFRINQTTSNEPAGANIQGIALGSAGWGSFCRDAQTPFFIGRKGNDGTLITFYQEGVEEGNISVSGNTVSYNQFLGAHWAALTNWGRPEIKIGTILETINELTNWKYAVIEAEGKQKKICYNGTAETGSTVVVEYEGEEYEGIVELEADPEFNKAVKVKVNDTAASKAVYGVFVGWNTDSRGDGGVWNDMYVGAVGNYVIRMAAGQEPEIGDLVEADGTGCAVLQDDDIIRTKTVAKITSTIPQVTYDDGSFLVTCVLYCG